MIVFIREDFPLTGMLPARGRMAILSAFPITSAVVNTGMLAREQRKP
ncbi:MAG: hypothetical protein ACXW4S_05475 [Candidatus Deferrimicrobiaceae bacterium]